MVVLAQLVEHRIVVPSVVGSIPTFHPGKSALLALIFFFYPLFKYRMRGKKAIRTCISASAYTHAYVFL